MLTNTNKKITDVTTIYFVSQNIMMCFYCRLKCPLSSAVVLASYSVQCKLRKWRHLTLWLAALP